MTSSPVQPTSGVGKYPSSTGRHRRPPTRCPNSVSHVLLLNSSRTGAARDHHILRGPAMSSSTTTISTVSIPDGKDEDFLTLAEAAAILRVPVNTLRWWRQCGDGPRFFKI